MHIPSISNLLRPLRGTDARIATAVPVRAQFSNLAGTAYKRHIQSLHENGDRRNPDILAGALLTPDERDHCLRLTADTLDGMRRDGYYYYLTARTKAYDQWLLDAVVAGVRRVLIVGSGFDTRLYRFGGLLAAQGVEVAECDQPEAIARKKELAASLPSSQRVQYFDIDLNVPNTWLRLWDWLGPRASPALLIAEGVSPYIERASFLAILELLAARLPASSRLVYDFKVAGVADEFGVSPQVSSPFRLPMDEHKIIALHQQLGFNQAALVTSQDLMHGQIPSWNERISPLYVEDALLHVMR